MLPGVVRLNYSEGHFVSLEQCQTGQDVSYVYGPHSGISLGEVAQLKTFLHHGSPETDDVNPHDQNSPRRNHMRACKSPVRRTVDNEYQLKLLRASMVTGVRVSDLQVAKSSQKDLFGYLYALRGNRTPGGSMATTQVTTTPLMLDNLTC